MVDIELLGLALFIIAIIIAAFIFWIIWYLIIQHPEQQKNILKQFSSQVINQVALEYESLSDYQRRQIAEEKMRNIFKDQNIAPPGDSMIETAIADAMYRQKMNEDNRWIEELKADQIAQTDTAEMLAVKVKEWVL
ncbi:MAG TPA: phage holin, LLH family [Ktedonobacteraceae bacterium]|jgi:hypothetical protein